MEWFCLGIGSDMVGGVVGQKSPNQMMGLGWAVRMAGEGVLCWEPEILLYGLDTIGEMWIGGSLISGELSSGLVSGEESEFQDRRF